jgi:hypothetical protein
MPSEALRNIRTMRQVKSSLDIARHQKSRTTNSLSKSEGEAAYLLSLTDPRVKQILAKETKHFAAMEASMDRSRGRMLKARDKLATTINKNRTLTELRHELQQSRLEGKNPTPEKAPIQAEVKAQPKRPTRKPRKQKLRRVELKY